MNSRAYSALAALAALLAYIATASPGGYWLDGGEIVSATVALDIIHPPGHPLAALWGKAFTLLPLGGLPFRVALGQSIAAALAVFFVCEALRRTLLALELPDDLTGPLAAAGGGLVAFCFGLWFQAVRPEVYALQALTLAIGIERLSALFMGHCRDGRALLAASVAIGLGLTNHHLMAFFFFPPLAYGALRLAWARRDRGMARALRPLWLCAAAGALCLLVYLYLPVRAQHADLPLALGTPTTLERVVWVVSARVYARDMGDANPQPLHERYLDVLVVLYEQLGVLALVLAFIGGYATLRDRRLRAAGGFWLLIGASVLLVRPWIGPVRGNPDSMGYLFGGYAAVSALAALGAGALLAAWPRAMEGAPIARWLVLAGCALSLTAHAATQAERSTLASFAATEPFDEARLRSLPPRSVLIAAMPQTVFRHLELQTVERARPDVALVPLPFLRYPGVAERLAARAPATAGIVRSYFESGAFGPRALLSAAAKQPVFVELDVDHVPPESYPALVPAGALYQVRDRTIPFEAARRALGQEQAMVALRRAAGASILEPEVKQLLVWLYYMDALYFAATAQRQAALRALEQARALAPSDEHVRALHEALADDPGGGELDVRPFLRFD